MNIRSFLRVSKTRVVQGKCKNLTHNFKLEEIEEESGVSEEEDPILKKIRKRQLKRRIRHLETAYWDKHPTHFIETTRFNSASLEVNRHARGEGCLYGNPYPLKKRQQPFRFVLELNNDTNRIEGVGLISAKSLLRGSQEVFRNVYENVLFNQNVYRGQYRVGRKVLDDYNEFSAELIQQLEDCCFHGFHHVKRGNGFSKLPFVHILSLEKEFGVDLVDFLRGIFKHHFQGSKE